MLSKLGNLKFFAIDALTRPNKAGSLKLYRSVGTYRPMRKNIDHVDNRNYLFRTSQFKFISSSKSLLQNKESGSNVDGKSTESVDPPSKPQEEASDKKEVVKIDYDDQDDYYQEPQTPKEKVKFYFFLAMRLALLAAGGYCVYLTGKELFPGRMHPQTLFTEGFEYLRYNDQILEIIGDSITAYGRDSGRGTEGRRNHVDSYKYDGDDGSSRLRVRFHIKGSKGTLRVWAEVSDRMPANEFVYIICQDIRNGRVYTMVDNRDELAAGLQTADSSQINRFFFNKK